MKILFPFFAFLLVIVASSFTLPAVSPEAPEAAVDYFLKLDGIDGESTDDKHKNEIEILSYSLNRTAQTVQIVRKTTRKSSAKIATACAQGQHIKKAVLFVRKSGGGTETYSKIELENVLISSYQTSASSSGIPTESFSLNYTKVTF